jgi:hypothetical protein
MKLDNLDRVFTRIGARVKFEFRTGPAADHGPGLRQDEQGTFYLLDLQWARQDRYEVLDVQSRHQALILAEPAKYLCRHDGKRWTVRQVDQTSVAAALADRGGDRPAPSRRDRPIPAFHPAQVRQGNWVFLPRFDFQPTALVAHRDTPPLRRCRKLGFVAEYECRVGPADAQPPSRLEGLYVRGWVWQPDQAAVTLRVWHQAIRL